MQYIKTLKRRKVFMFLVLMSAIAILLFSYRNDLSEEASIPPLYTGLRWSQTLVTQKLDEGRFNKKRYLIMRYKGNEEDTIKKQQAVIIRRYYEQQLQDRGWTGYSQKLIDDENSFAIEYVKPQYPLLCPMFYLLQEHLPCIGKVRLFAMFYNAYEGKMVDVSIFFSESIQ